MAARMKATFGRTVAYTRPPSSRTNPPSAQDPLSIRFVAWPGKTLFARLMNNDDESSVAWGDLDYLFLLADAKAAGFVWPPVQGDRITDPTVLDPTTLQPVVFQLMTPTGEPIWRYSDEGRTTVRVHCKRVA